MQEHQFIQMADYLATAGLFPPEQKEEAEKVLRAYWSDRIAVTWTVEDVLDVCPGLTEEEAMKILLSEAVGGDDDCEATAECIRYTAAEWYGDRAFAEGGGEEDGDTP